MKRLITVLCLVAVICCAGFAEEVNSADVKYRTTSGGFWSCGQDFSGGFGEFGINLLPVEKTFVLRDCIYVMGTGGHLTPTGLDTGGIEIGDKLILGGRYNCSGFIVRTYGFMGGGVKFYGCEGHKILNAPMIDLGFGGGFEFQYATDCAFVVEFGGQNRILTGKYNKLFKDYSRSSPMLTIGFRSFR
ncbi:MAG: hypothetical protein K5907_01435 [Treponema sp.]|nr:hypothetical protein [Treponema sp.]